MTAPKGSAFRVCVDAAPLLEREIAVRAGLDGALVKEIQTALVELARSPAGRQVIVGSRRKLHGYAAAHDRLYAGVRRTDRGAGRGHPGCSWPWRAHRPQPYDLAFDSTAGAAHRIACLARPSPIAPSGPLRSFHVQ